MRSSIQGLLLSFGLYGSVLAQSSPGSVTNYTTKGNLEVTTSVPCVEFKGLNNSMSAADIYAGLPLCLKAKDFARAAQMFALAGTFATFDKLRVADRTAHQAHTVLTMQALGGLSPEDRQSFTSAMNHLLDKSSPELVSTCKTIRSIGAPSYYPRYMVQHGMRAFEGAQSNGGIVEGFNALQSWEKALDVYLHCPAT